MPLTIIKSQNGEVLTIKISGQFVYEIHREFRQAYENTGTVSKYIVDLRETTYIDSSALGMLLLLQKYAGGKQENVEIINCASSVVKVLEIANFHESFKISKSYSNSTTN